MSVTLNLFSLGQEWVVKSNPATLCAIEIHFGDRGYSQGVLS